MKRLAAAVTTAALLLVVGSALLGLHRKFYPRIELAEKALPTFNKQPPERELFSLTMRLKAHFPDRFQVFVDDCLDRLELGGETPPLVPLPLCPPYPHGGSIDLSGTLLPGTVQGMFELRNVVGRSGFSMNAARVPSPWGDVRLLWYVLLAAAAVLPFLFSHGGTQRWLFVLPVLLGVVVRCLYFESTPMGAREHDYHSQLEYVRYYAANGGPPPAGYCHVCHHPPLYYGLAAWWLGQKTETLPEHVLIGELHGFSMLLSVAAVVASLLLAKELFSLAAGRFERSAVLSFSLYLAVLPGLALQATRLNNDSLATPLSFFAVYGAIRWWRTASRSGAILSMLTCAAGLAAKLSLAPICVLTALLIAFRRGSPRKERAALLILGCLIVAGAQAALPDPVERNRPRDYALKGVDVGASTDGLLTFNPLAVLRLPYNNPWNDEARRGMFPEYFVRSALFSEYSFPAVGETPARVLLLIVFAVLIRAAVGMLDCRRERRPCDLPMLLCLALTLAAVVYLRLNHPIASAQDFRYVPAAALSVAYFATRPLGSTRLTTAVPAWAFAAASVYFFVRVYVAGA